MRRLAALLAAAVLALLAFTASPARASDSSDESRFVELTNASRQAAGLGSLDVAGDLVAVAEGQAQRMASSNTLYHNPNLATEVQDWQHVGENVGRQGTVDQIHEAFMNSPHHRDNILGDYSQIGVGVAHSADGTLYVAEVFRLPAGASAPAPVADDPAPEPQADAAPAPAPEPPTTDAPAPEPPPTTEATTTTTTIAVTSVPVSDLAAQAGNITPRTVSAIAPIPVASRTPLLVAWFAGVLAISVMGAHLVVIRRTRMAVARP